MSARACIIPVFVPHLGCAHNCVFCNQRHIAGQTKPADAMTVRAALSQAASLPKGAKRQLAFYGGSFTAIPAAQQEELFAAAKEAIERGELDSIRLSTRPDAIDEIILARLKSCGVETIELGAQSMDDEVLRLSGRGHTAEDVERASHLIQSAGFSLVLQMMTGLPGSDADSDYRTAERIAALRPDGARIYPTVIVRDTELYERWKSGEYREHTVEDATETCARILPLFEEAGIPVIRIGLNPTEELSGGAAVAGAYHPALGELVKSRILRKRAEELLRAVPAGSRVTLGVDRPLISQLIGQHRANLSWLKTRYGLSALKILPLDTKKREIRVIAVEK